MPNGAKTVLDCSDQSGRAGGRRQQLKTWYGQRLLGTVTWVSAATNLTLAHLSVTDTMYTIQLRMPWWRHHKIHTNSVTQGYQWCVHSTLGLTEWLVHANNWPLFSFSSKLRWEWLIPVRYLTATQLLEKNLGANNHRREESQRIIKSSDDAGDVVFSGSQLTW